MDLKRLVEPFHPSELEWRVQTAGEKNGRVWAMVLAYVTNRAIMARLDAVCGADNWRNEFAAGPGGGILCGVSVRVPRAGAGGGAGAPSAEWVTKWDGAAETDVEAVKGGLSSAMKRAAVQWGIGRYLYALEEGWATIHENGAHSGKTKDGKWFKWDPPALPAWALPEGYGGATTERERAEMRAASAPAPRPQLVPDETSAPDTRPDTRLGAALAASDARRDAQANPPSPLDADAMRCPKCEGQMWDNRAGKRNPKAPDFKCRDKNCDGVIWPPREARTNAARGGAAGGGAKQPVSAGGPLPGEEGWAPLDDAAVGA